MVGVIGLSGFIINNVGGGDNGFRWDVDVERFLFGAGDVSVAEMNW